MESVLLKKSTIITIPYAPLSMNQQERMHWAKWQREKRQWIHDVFYLVKQYGNKIPQHRDHIWITKIAITFTRIRVRDESNYEPMIIKPLADALVSAKIIPNDTSQYITRPGKVDLNIGPDPKTEITLEYN